LNLILKKLSENISQKLFSFNCTIISTVQIFSSVEYYALEHIVSCWKGLPVIHKMRYFLQFLYVCFDLESLCVQCFTRLLFHRFAFTNSGLLRSFVLQSFTFLLMKKWSLYRASATTTRSPFKERSWCLDGMLSLSQISPNHSLINNYADCIQCHIWHHIHIWKGGSQNFAIK
jgi:hypothetical protein